MSYPPHSSPPHGYQDSYDLPQYPTSPPPSQPQQGAGHHYPEPSYGGYGNYQHLNHEYDYPGSPPLNPHQSVYDIPVQPMSNPTSPRQTAYDPPSGHYENAEVTYGGPGFSTHGTDATGAGGLPNPFETPSENQHGASTIELPYPRRQSMNGGHGDHAPLLNTSEYSTPPFPGGFVRPPSEEENFIRYGRIPQRQPRRYKTVKRMELYHGNFVYDCKVPGKLLSLSKEKGGREFTHMRYTAATCDPDDFEKEQYSLRQVLYDPPRRTELFIVMTMYNEDEELFTRTMHGVIKNIQHLCTRDRSKTWGNEGWKKVVVCIVSDGRSKINSRTLSVLAGMGVYQEGVAKNIIERNGQARPVTAHIYEYTTQVYVDPSLQFRSTENSKGQAVPIQIIFCLKEKNQKKINSHRWFFNAFGRLLKPNVCVLLDVGTQPGPKSIYHLWKTFDVNSNVGGACGEIVALKGKYLRNLINPLVAAQNFEYKISNILDKPLESVFGYITVLPGAFSAYRYTALQNNEHGEGPLKEYFKGETLHTNADANLWDKNMYLAEDRILCWELVSKRNCGWILRYVKSAYAVTDVPDQVPELISQRRRWLNGSFFAAIHSITHFGYLYRSDHSFVRKLWLHVEFFYQVFNLIFAWFALANFYIAFYILSNSLEDPTFGIGGWIKVFNDILNYLYLGLLVACFLLAMGNRPQGSKWSFTIAMIAYAFITVYITFAAFFITFKGIENAKDAIEEDDGSFSVSDVFTNSIFRNIVISLLSTYGLYLIASVIFFEPWHMFTSFIQYLLLAPSWINVINTYAFCNVHDVSWGTKGDNKVETDLGVVKTTGEGKGNTVDVAVPTEKEDIDAAYEDAVHVLASKPPPPVTKVDEATKVEDAYRNIRTNVVLTWALTNGALVAGILSSDAGSNITGGSSAKVNGYLSFLLFSVAGLAAIRFVGCVVYITIYIFQG